MDADYLKRPIKQVSETIRNIGQSKSPHRWQGNFAEAACNLNISKAETVS